MITLEFPYTKRVTKMSKRFNMSGDTIISIAFWALFVVAALALSCSNADAQLPPPEFEDVQLVEPNELNMPDGAAVAPMTQGLRAPFGGVLWNDLAMAWLITDFEHVQFLLVEEMDRRVAVTRAWAVREIETRENQYQTDRASLSLQLSARDEQIRDLEEVNRDLEGQVGFTLREKTIVVVVTVGVAAAVGTGAYLIGRATR